MVRTLTHWGLPQAATPRLLNRSRYTWAHHKLFDGEAPCVRVDDSGAARVGLAEVDAVHPAARLAGTDNLFALTTTRYAAQPLVISGPGAGPDVTAQALLGDLLAIRG